MTDIGNLEAESWQRSDERAAERREIALAAIDALGLEATELEICRRAVRPLVADGEVLFAMIYLVEGHRSGARLAGSIGIEEDGRWSPRWLSLDEAEGWPLDHVASTGERALLGQLETRFGSRPVGTRGEAHVAQLLPVRGRLGDPVRAVLIVGTSGDDRAISAFLDAAADRISSALARCRSRGNEDSGRLS